MQNGGQRLFVVFALLSWGMPQAVAADKSGVSPTTISLPTGPGSVEGLGESFQPALNSGTARYGIKLAVPPGPSGHGPALSLQYEGGAGNGVVGFGWAVPLAHVQRRTDRGIPTYGIRFGFAREDRFINEMKEELVPQGGGLFFCENEGAFVRYRRTNDWWEGTLPDGIRLEFGRTSAARVVDGTNVFSWLLERQIDTRGNAIMYVYTNLPGVTNLNQRYLSMVRYGAGPAPWSNYHFVKFEYEGRSDWFEDCRAGFAVRTGQRLKRIVVGTQGPALPGHAHGDFDGDGQLDNLVRRYDLSYVNYAGTNTHWSLLQGVVTFGADGISSLPASTFGYRVCDPPVNSSAAGYVILSTNTPAFLMDSALVDLLDVNADGLPDIFKTDLGGGAHSVYLNQGEKEAGSGRTLTWASSQPMTGSAQAFSYNLQAEEGSGGYGAHLSDMDGDGVADLAVKSGLGDVFFFRNQGRLNWGNRQLMSIQDFAPPAPFGSPDVRVADIDFDKRIDIIRSIGINLGYQVWFNLGNQTYSSRYYAQPESGTSLDFAQSGAQLAEVNGDRVTDIARISADRVVVAAGLGYGRFRPLETMFLDFVLTDTQLGRAKLTDINGDGLEDLVVERAEGAGILWYWENRGTYRFGPRKRVTGLPQPAGLSPAIRWADLNGNGTVDYVFADPSSSPRLQAVELSELLNCGSTPNLLLAISNGIGRVTLIGYAPSTKYRLADVAAGNPWTNSMPMVVEVVSAVTNLDSLGHQYVSRFVYHDGYYDPVEKQFRGFASVEQIDVGDSNAPTLVTRSYFDTGRDFESMKGKLLRLTSETEDGRMFVDDATSWLLPPRTLMTGTNGQAVNYALPTGHRKWVKELGQGTERLLESEMAFDNFGNQTANADYGIVENGNRSAFDDERITTTEYAINTNTWILRAPKLAEVKDENGMVISRTEMFYDDETFAGNNLGLVSIGNLTMKREWIDPSNPSAYITSMRAKYDPFGNISHALDPLAVAPGGAVNVSQGHLRTLDYDNRFHTYPVTETIHVGGGTAPLVFQVSYDEGFGTVRTATDFNGKQTSFGYDVFARLVHIVRPGDSVDYPTSEYEYALAIPFSGSNLINYVETRQLDRVPDTASDKRGHYIISRQFVDGMGRKLMTKQEAEPASDSTTPRVVVSEAVTFNARLKAARVLNPFFSLTSGATLDELLAYESVEASGWMGQFEEQGTLVSLGLAAAHQSATVYDATLRQVESVNPDGTRSRTVYEPLLTRSYDENDTDPGSPYADTPMVHVNDGLGRLIQVDEVTRLNDDGTSAGSLRPWTTTYSYDLNDQLRFIRDSQDNVKEFRYDGLKRKLFMNDPDRGVMSFAYDSASNLTNSLDAKNQRITYTYDGVNRILTEDYHDENAAEFSYRRSPDVAYQYDVPVANLDQGDNTVATASNTRGKLAWVEDASGEEHTSFDARDRVAWSVKRVRDPLHGQLVDYRTGFAYDSLDRLVTLTYPDNDAVSYEYNERGLLRRIPGGPNGSIISNIVYLPSASMRRIDYGNGVHTTYNYDSRLRLNKLLTVSSHINTELIHFGYEFDNASNIKTIEDRRPGSAVPAGDKRRNTQVFQYDDLYRLTRVQYSFTLPGAAPSNDGEINYRYDRIGNMLAQTSTMDHQEKDLPVSNLGAMDSGGTAGRSGRVGRAANDSPGPHALTRIRRSGVADRLYPYDANGNMKIIDGLTNTWDFKDRLVRVENEEMVADYRYDYTDRRITKRVEKKPDSALGATTSAASGPPPPAAVGKQLPP